MRRGEGREDGIALILTLLFVVLLAAIVVEYGYEARVETGQTQAGLNQFQAELAARSAVHAGISLLYADAYPESLDTEDSSSSSSDEVSSAQYDALDESWALGVPFDRLNDAVMQCTISDECGKLNLNALVTTGPDGEQVNEAVEQPLRQLFLNRNVLEDPVDAIIDWIDGVGDERTLGAESTYYESLEVPYACKDAPLTNVEELLLIRGITADVFFGDPDTDQLPLTELLTVCGDEDEFKINVNTAPLEVLEAVCAACERPGLAEVIITRRETSPFLTADDLNAELGLETGTGGQGGDDPLASLLTIQSQCFRVRGHGIAGESKIRIEAYVSREETSDAAVPLRILDWRVVR